MTHIERRLLVQSGLIGAVLTLAMAGADMAGWLEPLEQKLHDRRARDCQLFAPAPTSLLVHLDIDDNSLDQIGPWPWPRSYMADLVDEIRLAGAKAVAMDILYQERQPKLTVETKDGRKVKVDHDARFAQAIERYGGALIPLSLEPWHPDTPMFAGLVNALKEDLERTRVQCSEWLVTAGLLRPEAQVDRDTFIAARRRAMRDRIRREMDKDVTDIEALRTRLLPRTPREITGSPLIRLLNNQYEKLQSLALLARFTRPAGDVPDVLRVRAPYPPIEPLSRTMAMTGFVDYEPDSDGVIRSIPLWVDLNGRLYPQLSLALACMMLDVARKDLAITSGHVTIDPPHGKPRVIPVRTRNAAQYRRRVATVMDIPWFGPTHDWLNMYGPGGRQHLSAVKVWSAHQIERKIRSNCRTADAAFKAVFIVTNKNLEKDLRANPLPLTDVESRLGLLKRAVEDCDLYLPIFKAMSRQEMAQYIDEEVAKEREDVSDVVNGPLAMTEPDREAYLQSLEPDQRTAIEKLLLDGGVDRHVALYREGLSHGTELLVDGVEGFVRPVEPLRLINRELPLLVKQLEEARKELREQLEGRAVMIGWTAAGKVDFKPTSLHAKCPGVVVHGAIFNGILTGDILSRAGHWVTLLITLIVGLLATAAAALLAPIRALLAAVFLGGAYWVINGVVLYDLGNTIVGIAGPSVTVVMVWSGCTIYKFVLERRERARITGRFRSYVDPALVNYVIENPDQARLDGQERELTVVFTDLAGFTTLSEKLKSRTVPLLNRYMGLMVPIIRSHNGYVNKFLGDGIMSFFGAPRDNQLHAADAVSTVLEMQRMMIPFNEALAGEGLPTLKMRVGVSTGEMVVGDAGSADASDYTVLGDTVNLGARLESANKYTGTLIMINDRTAELIGDIFLLRPIGRLVVVGKAEGVMVYEPMAVRERATDEQQQLVESTTRMVDSYIAGDFDQCLRHIGALEKITGPHKLTDLYREHCQQHLANPPQNGFGGHIVLTEK